MPTSIMGGAATPVFVVNGVSESGGNGNSSVVVEQRQYTTVKTGELAGTASSVPMPDIVCRLVKFKARNNNTGNVYIGSGTVTRPDGSTDATTGLELDAGEETGWIPVDNLNRMAYICDSTSDRLTYMALDE